MDDLEEGELPEETDATVANKECGSVVSNLWRSEIAVASISSSHDMRVPKKPAKLRRNSSSDSDSDDGVKSCSDDEYEPGDKKWLGSGHVNVTSGRTLPNVQSGNDCNQNAAFFTQQKKKYNIWGSVLEEQSLAKDLSGWFGMNKKVESDRDVETYDYTNALKDDRSDLDVPGSPSVSQTENCGHFDVSNICDRETFGTDAAVKTAVKTPGSPASNHFNEEQSDADDNVFKKDVYTKRPCLNDPNRPAAKGRLGVRATNSNVTSTTNVVMSVGEELHQVLNEPEHMKTTFIRVAEVLGAEKARFLLRKTEVLEASGGLKILNGQRRRTPGGVYLYLLKNDESVTKAEYKEIFKDQFEEHKRLQREAKKRRWNDRVAKLQKSSVSADDMESSNTVEVHHDEGRSVPGVPIPAEIVDDDFEIIETVDIQLDL